MKTKYENVLENKINISGLPKEKVLELLQSGPAKILVPNLKDYYVDKNGAVRKRK